MIRNPAAACRCRGITCQSMAGGPEFVMEGFAMYGASLHPTATMPVQIIRSFQQADPHGSGMERGPWGARRAVVG